MPANYDKRTYSFTPTAMKLLWDEVGDDIRQQYLDEARRLVREHIADGVRLSKRTQKRAAAYVPSMDDEEELPF
jgi:hypothetical protein